MARALGPRKIHFGWGGDVTRDGEDRDRGLPGVGRTGAGAGPGPGAALADADADR